MKHFFKIFEWANGYEFLQSLMPSIKLQITTPLLFIGGFFGILSDMMGIQMNTIVAIFVALFAELLSGIYASLKRGEHIRSGKFGRFVVKAFVWLMSIFFVNAFCKEFASLENDVIKAIMVWVRSAFLMTCFFEYMVSINENMESITGKKSMFIKVLKEKVNQFFNSKDVKTEADNTTENTTQNTTEK